MLIPDHETRRLLVHERRERLLLDARRPWPLSLALRLPHAPPRARRAVPAPRLGAQER